ncbi:MAG: hypothetical protein AAF456_00775 [Planctomycetota bacterium]
MTNERERQPRNLLLIACTIGGIMLLSCGGCAGWMYYMYKQSTIEVEDQLRSDRMVREQLGEVLAIEIDFAASGEADRGPNEWVYIIEGSSATGRAIIEKKITGSGYEQIGPGSTLIIGEDDQQQVFDLDY